MTRLTASSSTCYNSILIILEFMTIVVTEISVHQGLHQRRSPLAAQSRSICRCSFSTLHKVWTDNQMVPSRQAGLSSRDGLWIRQCSTADSQNFLSGDRRHNSCPIRAARSQLISSTLRISNTKRRSRFTSCAVGIWEDLSMIHGCARHYTNKIRLD